MEKCKFDMLKAKCVSSFHTLTQNDGVVLGLAGIYSINFYQTLHYMILFKYFTLKRDHRDQIANLLRPFWTAYTLRSHAHF